MRRFAILTAAMTLVLILAGGFVTTTRTGNTIPTWPKTWGHMHTGWQIEATHRYAAAIVGILVLGLAFGSRRPLAWVAFGAVVVQVLIGGLRIFADRHDFVLPKVPVAIIHAVFAQVIFCAMAALAFMRKEPVETPGRGLGIAATAASFLQLVAGAVTRHTGAGLAVHLVGAAAVLILGALFASNLMLTPLRGGARLLTTLLCGQIVLGFAAWMFHASKLERPVPLMILVTLHVAAGALVLATTLVLTLNGRRANTPAPALA